MARRKSDPSNTAASAVRTAQEAAAGPIEPPDHVFLRECDLPYWQSITTAKRPDAWTGADLEIAASLARTKADAARLSSELEGEADVMENASGSPIVNPKHRLLETLTARIVRLSRLLQIHPLATSGRSADQRSRNEAARDAAEGWGDDDDLIAKPVITRTKH